MIRNILVLNLKLIGDLIVSTPAIRSLKEAFPESRIDILIRKGFEEVLSGNPDINNIIGFDKNLKNAGLFGKLFYEIKFINKLRANKYDLVVALQPGDRYAIWSFLSGAAKRVGVKKQSFSFLFNIHSFVEEDTIPYIDYYLEIAAAAGGKNSLKKTAFFVNESDRDFAEKIIRDSNISSSEKIIVIHPGASDKLRCWSPDNFIQLTREIQKIPGTKAIISFGPSEKDIIAVFKSALENPIIYDSTRGIRAIGAIIEKSALCISNDTSIRHIAVALGVPVITLMPADVAKFWNFYNDTSKEFVILGKRGISSSSDKNLNSLHGIEVADVLSKVREYLRNLS